MEPYKRVSDCPVTQSSATIFYPYIDNKQDPWYKKYGGYHTGVDIECSDIYSVCPCVVIYVGQSNLDKYKVIIIQYNAEISFRYCHLDEVYVKAGQAVSLGTLIGKAHKFCQFEYLTTTQNDSNWVVRVSSKDMFCQDPEDYADGTSVLLGSGKVNPDDPDVDTDIVIIDFPQTTLDLYGDGW